MEQTINDLIRKHYLQGLNPSQIKDKTGVTFIKIAEVIQDVVNEHVLFNKKDRILQARTMEINCYNLAVEEANTGKINPELDKLNQVMSTYCA